MFPEIWDFPVSEVTWCDGTGNRRIGVGRGSGSGFGQGSGEEIWQGEQCLTHGFSRSSGGVRSSSGGRRRSVNDLEKMLRWVRSSWHWQVVTFFMNFLSCRRLLSDCSRQTDRQTDGQTERKTTQGARKNVFKFKLRRLLLSVPVPKFFLVGVTNLAPVLALIK